jgi:K319L-like, PKD domain
MRNSIGFVFGKGGRSTLCFLLVLATLLAVGPAAALAQDITVNGSPIKGVLPLIVTAFATEDGLDVLPLGGVDYSAITLFDTGANKVYFDPLIASALGVSSGLILDIRISGLSAIDDGTLEAPMYPDSVPPPQAEVQDVEVSLWSGDMTLIGGPVTNVVKAVIDYTTTVTKGPFDGGVYLTGPDITFYPAGSPVGYTPAITLAMQAFGTYAGVYGKRFWMFNVSFNEGDKNVSSPSLESGEDLGLTSTRFLYDTGTRPTFIKQVLADALSLSGTPDFEETVNGVLRPGYYLDSITMTGAGRVYTVLNAPVIIVPDEIVGTGDAVIGSNLFSQVKLLWDGPNATLGIGVATNSPPVANAGADQMIEANGNPTSFTLDGSASSDPDGDTLTYSWKDEYGNDAGSTATVNLSGILGAHTFTLTVTDAGGLFNEDTVTVTIVDTTPPTLMAPPDKTVPEADPMGTAVDLGVPNITDNYYTSFTVSDNAPDLFLLGVTTVIWVATDGSGNTSTAQQKVTVVPGTPLNQLGNLVKLISYSVASGGIAPEMQTSLLAKINAAIAALIQGNPNASKVAMNDLKALVNQVNAQTDKKITPVVANEIITRANRVILALGG